MSAVRNHRTRVSDSRSPGWWCKCGLVYLCLLAGAGKTHAHDCPNGASVLDGPNQETYCNAIVVYRQSGSIKLDKRISNRFPPPPQGAPQIRSIAMIVANSDYPNFQLEADRKLEAVDKDIPRFLLLLKEQQFDEVILLKNASKENIWYFLTDYLVSELGQFPGTGRFLFAYDGHGSPGSPDPASGGLALSGSRGAHDPNPRNTYDLTDLSAHLKKLASLSYQTIALLGSCYSGGVFQVSLPEGQKLEDTQDPGAHAVTATAADQLAWVRVSGSGTVFFEELIDAIQFQRKPSDVFEGNWGSDANGNRIDLGMDVVALARLVSDINDDLQLHQNPVTHQPYPLLELGRLTAIPKYEGSFFFLRPRIDQRTSTTGNQPVAAQHLAAHQGVAALSPRVEIAAAVVMSEPIAAPVHNMSLALPPVGGFPESSAFPDRHEEPAPMQPQTAPAPRPADAAGTSSFRDLFFHNTGSAVVGHPELKVFKPPVSYRIAGVNVEDTSRLNFDDLARQNRIRFVYLHATDGAGFVDRSFERNLEAARRTSLRIGAIHSFDVCQTAKAQFKNISAVVPADGSLLPLAIDLEWTGDHPMVLSDSYSCPRQDDPSRIRKEFHALVGLIKKHYNKDPIIYSDNDAFALLFGDDFIKNAIWLEEPSWRGKIRRPPSLSGRNPWTLWEVNDGYRIPGFQRNLDFSVFFGSDEQFERFARGEGNVALEAALQP